MNTPQDSTQRPAAHGQASGSSGGTHAHDSAEDLAEKARAEGQEQVQHYRDVAADKVDTLADSVKAAASELKDDDVAHLSRHISDMASGLSQLSDGLREKSTDQILRDVGRVARENPTLFIAGSIAIGFGIARFARASAPSQQDRNQHSHLGSTGDRSKHTRSSGTDSAVPGTTAKPATDNNTVDTVSSTGAVGTLSAIPGPAVANTEEGSTWTGGATASDSTISGRGTPPSTDTPRGRTQP